jgi:hypothetical protein
MVCKIGLKASYAGKGGGAEFKRYSNFSPKKMKVGCDDADDLIQAVYLEKSG